MYKTFTITITMPMSWYSQNCDAVKRSVALIKRCLTSKDITVDVQETPDPTELSVDCSPSCAMTELEILTDNQPSNITDLRPYLDYGDDEIDGDRNDDTNEPL
jgi:hypothetical protein